MDEEILVNVTAQETRVAVVENGVLQEIYIERSHNRGIVGNLYLGKVIRVLPGMQAAFVDIGLAKAAFLHVYDMQPKQDDNEDWATSHEERTDNISDLLVDDQVLLVQVTKEPIGTKGPRLTTRIAIPSRHLVFMPTLTQIGVSQRIEDGAERERLRAIVAAIDHNLNGSFIIRTAAEGVSLQELQSSVSYLEKLWQLIQETLKRGGEGRLIHEDLPISLRSIRDLVRSNTRKIRIDSCEQVDSARAFARKLVPEISDKIELYTGYGAIFELYGVEDEIQKALQCKIALKSGGHLVIEQTEAMTTIDVNTGAFVGTRNLDDTIFKTNLEAAQAIARQLKVRNLGGIIIIDFIDMVDVSHKEQVLQSLEKAFLKDHAKAKICEVSPLGLVEMTRKRTRESLSGVLSETCSACGGRGTIKSAQTVCYEIFREIFRSQRVYDATGYLVLASQGVIDLLLDEESASIAELEMLLKKPIRLQVEALYTQEQFDVVLT